MLGWGLVGQALTCQHLGCGKLPSQTTHRPSLQKPHSSRPCVQATPTGLQPSPPGRGAQPLGSDPETSTCEDPQRAPRERPNMLVACWVCSREGSSEPHINSSPGSHIAPVGLRSNVTRPLTKLRSSPSKQKRGLIVWHRLTAERGRVARASAARCHSEIYFETAKLCKEQEAFYSQI